MFKLSSTFQAFFESEKAGGFLLILATIVSLAIANSSFALSYEAFWHQSLLGLSITHWVNDALMAIFFLLIGLELERELYVGELSSFSNALLPIVAAVGGMLLPALIYWQIGHNTPYSAGVGIPMATDIAFALGVLSMLGSRIPPALKVFLVAFAVIDDLGASVMIALFYTSHIALPYLFAALGLFAVLLIFNKMRVMQLWPYLAVGIIIWWLVLMSGVHPTLAGIALAFAVPFGKKGAHMDSPSHRLEHSLHRPVAFVILPIFALANTAVTVDMQTLSQLPTHPITWGVVAGLVLGKPIGVCLGVFITTRLFGYALPEQMQWAHVLGAGLLGGIGFTMSIFVTNLAFANMEDAITLAKMAILLASVCAGLLGFLWLQVFSQYRA